MRGRYSVGRREIVGTGGEPGGCGTEYGLRAWSAGMKTSL